MLSENNQRIPGDYFFLNNNLSTVFFKIFLLGRFLNMHFIKRSQDFGPSKKFLFSFPDFYRFLVLFKTIESHCFSSAIIIQCQRPIEAKSCKVSNLKRKGCFEDLSALNKHINLLSVQGHKSFDNMSWSQMLLEFFQNLNCQN